MDKDNICHDIAIQCASKYVESNMPEYKQLGYPTLVNDFVDTYLEAFDIAEKKIDSPTPKVKVINRKDFGL